MDVALLRPQAERLRAMGCEIAIDDFGTGPLRTLGLVELRPDYVKIDRYFTSQLDREPVAVELLRAPAGHGACARQPRGSRRHRERAAAELLRGIGVDYLQGFHIWQAAAAGSRRVGQLPHHSHRDRSESVCPASVTCAPIASPPHGR